MLQRNVYEVIVVGHVSGDIIASQRCTATSTESAMAKVGLQEICEKAELTTDDVEYIILKLGSLRGIQEVKQTEAKGL